MMPSVPVSKQNTGTLKFLIITDLGEVLYNLPKKLISKGSPASCHDTETG